MYNGIKSCIFVNNTYSEFFPCARGVRQGEDLLPALFFLYLNDVENYLLSNNNVSVDISDQNLDMYLRLAVILFANDTVLFANEEDELNSVLNTFYQYCCNWKLEINFEKTKIMVFGDKFKRNRFFSVNGKQIEVVDSFKYLGIIFSKNRQFASAKNHLCEQAKKGNA